MSLINYNSLIFLALLILAFAAFFLLRDGIHKRDMLILGGLVIVMVITWIFIRPISSVEGEANEVFAQIGGGLPVLLELQSPY